jgi:hypothetical protein
MGNISKDFRNADKIGRKVLASRQIRITRKGIHWMISKI